MTRLRHLCLCLLLFTSTAWADKAQETWKLLKTDEKQQFISGYLHAWSDIDEVLDIVARYIEENPEKALDGLHRIQSLYDFSKLSPSATSLAIDSFYREKENRGKSLSAAVSAYKNGDIGRKK